MRTPSVGSSSRRSGYLRRSDLLDGGDTVGSELAVGGAMLPLFLSDLHRDDQSSNSSELVEVTLEIDDDSVVVCSVAPTSAPENQPEGNGFFSRSSSVTSRIRRKFPWLRSASGRSSASGAEEPAAAVSFAARDARKLQAQLDRTRSSAQRALTGLRFISKTTSESAESSELWKRVEDRFDSLAKDGFLSRDDFAECIGMVETKEFGAGLFHALARRRRQKIDKINKDEFYDFWLQISDQSFDARLQIFFDMADSNADGRITREEVQELIMLSASANKLSKLKEQAEEYASLIMEELDPENLGYIELWQLEALLLRRDDYMNYSRPLSTTSAGRSQGVNGPKTRSTLVRTIGSLVRWRLMENNWERTWVVLVWAMAMAGLFTWKFFQYRNKSAFQVMGYCLTTAKGAAETLKLNMALVLLPVCRNTLTWLRSTRARLFVPFNDNIYFHKMVAVGILVGVVVHAGNHLLCDFPRLINSPASKFELVASDFGYKRPTYGGLVVGVEGLTGISMVVLMAISFTLATGQLRKNLVRLPPPLNRLTGFNAFWYSHHLFALVYVLLIVHGNFMFFVHKWYQRTTWMYISVPLLLYLGERTLRALRSEQYSVKILKVTVLPGNVLSLIFSKPQGFRYKSGQYIFLQCPTISSFEWHPFSITSAPGDDHISVHIRTAGDWTRELKKVYTEATRPPNNLVGRARFSENGTMEQNGLPRLLVDGPYGAPAQDFRNYDVLLLVGLGIGATPFISILRDLLNNIKAAEDLADAVTDTSRSDDSMNSFASSTTTSGTKKKPQRTSHAHFYWVTREPGSFEWFKGVMNEVAEMDLKGIIEMHNYLTSVYEEGDARSTLLAMVQALNHAKHGVDIVSGTRVRTHFARPNWREVFAKISSKHANATVGVFYCGMPGLAKELKRMSHEFSHRTSTRFEFHKEYF